MAGKGGYQRPTSPAPVSGPGALSQRTDGGPGSTQAARYVSGLEYGQGQQLMDIQQSAPMAASGSAPSRAASAQPAMTQAPLTPLTAASGRPSEPITHGADVGAGPAMDSLGLGAHSYDRRWPRSCLALVRRASRSSRCARAMSRGSRYSDRRETAL